MYSIFDLFKDIPVAGVLLIIVLMYGIAVLYIVVDAVYWSNGVIDEFEDVKETIQEPKSSNN